MFFLDQKETIKLKKGGFNPKSLPETGPIFKDMPESTEAKSDDLEGLF
jgi:hypothetical protein